MNKEEFRPAFKECSLVPKIICFLEKKMWVVSKIAKIKQSKCLYLNSLPIFIKILSASCLSLKYIFQNQPQAVYVNYHTPTTANNASFCIWISNYKWLCWSYIHFNFNNNWSLCMGCTRKNETTKSISLWLQIIICSFIYFILWWILAHSRT